MRMLSDIANSFKDMLFFLEMYLNGVGYFLEFIFFIPENKFDNNETYVHALKNSNFKHN